MVSELRDGYIRRADRGIISAPKNVIIFACALHIYLKVQYFLLMPNDFNWLAVSFCNATKFFQALDDVDYTVKFKKKNVTLLYSEYKGDHKKSACGRYPTVVRGCKE